MPVLKLSHVVIHPDSGSLVAVADLPVPAERLFRALTTADEIGRWWGGSKQMPNVLLVGVPHKGSGWRAEGSSRRRNRTFTLFGDILDVDKPRRIEATWHANWDNLAMTRLSIRLEPTAKGSVLTLMHQGFLGRHAACKRQGKLWYLAIRWLKAYFKAETEAEARRVAASLTGRQEVC